MLQFPLDRHLGGKLVLGKHAHLGLPHLRDKLRSVNPPLHLVPFKLLNEAVDASGGPLDGADDVLGEHLRQIVKEAGEVVVGAPLGAGVNRKGKQVRQDSNDEHVAKHRGPRNPVQLPPPHLEPKPPAQVHEAAVGRKQGELLQPFHVRECLLPPLQAALDLVDLVVVPVFVFDDVKLPLGCVEVGGVEDLSVDGVLRMKKIRLESFFQAIQVGDEGRESSIDLFFQLRECLLVGFDPLEDLWLDVRESEALEVLEKPALDDLCPAEVAARVQRTCRARRQWSSCVPACQVRSEERDTACRSSGAFQRPEKAR